MDHRRNLWIVFCIVLLDMLGIGILIPILPLLFDHSSTYFILGTNGSGGEYLWYGLLIAVYPLMQFLSAPILGELSDLYGRKRVLTACWIGTVIGYVIFALGILWGSVWLLFASRALAGAVGGNISVAQAVIADSTRPEDRASSFGLIGAGFGLGFILGPFLGGVLSSPHVLPWFNVVTPFWFAVLVSAFTLLLVLFWLPETHHVRPPKRGINLLKAFYNLGGAFRPGPLRRIFAVSFLFSIGFAFYTAFFSVFLLEQYGFSQWQIGNYFAYVGLWIVVTQAFVTPFISKRASESKVLHVSLAGTGLFIFLFFLPSAVWQLMLVTPFFAVFVGLTNANILAMVSRRAEAAVQGEVLGIVTSLSAFAQGVTPILAGLVAAQSNASAPLAVAGIIVLTAAALFRYSEPRTIAV